MITDPAKKRSILPFAAASRTGGVWRSGMQPRGRQISVISWAAVRIRAVVNVEAVQGSPFIENAERDVALIIESVVLPRENSPVEEPRDWASS